MVRVTIAVVMCLCPCHIGLGEDSTDAVSPTAIKGTWLRRQELADGTVVKVMKIITANHFSVIRQSDGNRRPDMFAAHAGRYELHDDVYEEIFEFSSTPNMIGKRSRTRLSIEGDTLKQIWTLRGGKTIVEVWKRYQEKPND